MGLIYYNQLWGFGAEGRSPGAAAAAAKAMAAAAAAANLPNAIFTETKEIVCGFGTGDAVVFDLSLATAGDCWFLQFVAHLRV